MFSVLEYCNRHHVPTLYTWNAVSMCFTLHVLVLYFAFVIRNADSLQLIKLFLNQGWRFLQLYSKLNLKSRPASMHFCTFLYSFFSWMSLTNSCWCQGLDNLEKLEVRRGLGRGELRNFSLLKLSLLVPRFITFPTCVELMNSYSFSPHYAYEEYKYTFMPNSG